MLPIFEYEFTLPIGWLDESGVLHKKGTMRLASAADEILPMKDPRVKSNPAYFSILVLARVIQHLGTLKVITPGMIEQMFIADFAYLQSFYEKINMGDVPEEKPVMPFMT
jgi:hypothetical protein